MTASMFCALVALFCLGVYWLGTRPEGWAALVELVMQEGKTEEAARISVGWKLLHVLAWAVACAVLGACP